MVSATSLLQFRGNLHLRGGGGLDDFTLKISFTYYKLNDNKYLTLNQLKICLFWSKILNKIDKFK